MTSTDFVTVFSGLVYVILIVLLVLVGIVVGYRILTGRRLK